MSLFYLLDYFLPLRTPSNICFLEKNQSHYFHHIFLLTNFFWFYNILFRADHQEHVQCHRHQTTDIYQPHCNLSTLWGIFIFLNFFLAFLSLLPHHPDSFLCVPSSDTKLFFMCLSSSVLLFIFQNVLERGVWIITILYVSTLGSREVKLFNTKAGKLGPPPQFCPVR